MDGKESDGNAITGARAGCLFQFPLVPIDLGSLINLSRPTYELRRLLSAFSGGNGIMATNSIRVVVSVD